MVFEPMAESARLHEQTTGSNVCRETAFTSEAATAPLFASPESDGSIGQRLKARLPNIRKTLIHFY